jgi:hypothetical protein
MVEIRSLQPKVTIRMPTTKAPKPYQPRNALKPVVRRAKDFPSPTPQPTPCRLWQGQEDSHGYGTFWVNSLGSTGRRQRRKMRLHRWVMEQALDRKLKPHEVVMHLCDNRLCFRIEHLRLGTYRDNNHDMMRKGRYVHAGGKKKRRSLTGTQVAAIRRRYLSGWHIETIAAEMGVSHNAVRRNVTGLNGAWRQAGNPLVVAPRTDPAGCVRGERNTTVKSKEDDDGAVGEVDEGAAGATP